MTTKKRTNIIKVRVNDEELEQIKKLSPTVSIAPFLRESALNAKVPRPRKEYPKINPQFMRKFAGACNNLNQLTRLANTEKDNLQKLNLAVELQKIRSELERLKNDVS